MTTTAAQERSIFITGAASGIGRATARLFAQRGWRVGCSDVNRAGLVDLEDELGSSAAMFQQLDVTDRHAVVASLDAFSDWTDGRLDLLFSNAGVDSKGSFDSMDWDRAMAVVNVNFVGSMSVIHAGLPLLKSTENSLCLATASASAIFGTAGLSVYSATKHAVRGLTEALSVELAAHGVRAMDILPGIIDTGMVDPDVKAMLPTDGMWRPLPPEDVASLVWDAYRGDKLHWYIPLELADLDVQVTSHPEATRDDRIAGRI